MSLLLQALQKAAKTREGAEGEQDPGTTAGSEDLSLEPLSEPRLGGDDAPTRSGPSSAQAATVMRASEPPSFSAIDWAREHYMLTFLGVAILFAIGYGTYVYIQISNPGLLRSTPPPVASPLAAASPPTAQAPAAEAQPVTRVSGLPTIDPPAAAASEPGVPAAPPPAAQPAVTPPRKPAPARPQRAAAPEAQTAAAVARVEDDSGLETIEIPPSLPLASARAELPRGDISVRRQAAGLATVDATLLAAYEALQAGDYPRAKELYEEVLRREPRSVDAMLGLAAIGWKHGRLEEAVGYYGRALDADPRNAHAQAGLIAMLGGVDPVAAESRLKQLIAREPSGFLYFTLGNLYAEQGQWSSAQQAYFQAHQLSPENADYAFNLAVGLEHLGQPKLALDYYRKALDLSFKRGRANFDQNLAIQRVGQLSARVD
jgi:tetratricopeptide (TPR) repeat protein